MSSDTLNIKNPFKNASINKQSYIKNLELLPKLLVWLPKKSTEEDPDPHSERNTGKTETHSVKIKQK